MIGEILAVCTSNKKGTQKRNIKTCNVKKGHGLEGDAHAGSNREVSLLSKESIDRSGLKVNFGDFGENLTTKDIELNKLPLGTKLLVGREITLEVTQIGKECERPCAIYYQTGDCIMPKEGIFAKVLKGGQVSVGDKIRVME